MEQNDGIPVVGGSGAGGGFSGFLPGQSYSFTAEQIVDNPVPLPGGAGVLQGFRHGQGSTAFSEQITELPDPGGGRQDFQPVQGSAASSSDLSGQAGEGIFRTVLRRAPRGRNWVPSRAHGRRELSWGLVSVTVPDKFQLSSSNCGWCLSSVHRRNSILPLRCRDRSSTSLSWRSCRFPWTDYHSDSSVAVHCSGVRCPCCAGPADSCEVVGDGRDPTVAARFLLDKLLLDRCVQQQVPMVDDSVQFIDGCELPCDYA